MIPDAATVARRRHTVTIIVRFLIAAYAAWCCYVFVTVTIAGLLATRLWLDFGPLYTLTNEWPKIVADLARFAILVCAIMLEQRIVRWIVPTPRPDTSCPKCGYSLKGLKTPICPECGAPTR